MAFIEINLESISGKKDDFRAITPEIPKTIKNITKMFTALGYLTKYVIIFLTNQ